MQLQSKIYVINPLILIVVVFYGKRNTCLLQFQQCQDFSWQTEVKDLLFSLAVMFILHFIKRNSLAVFHAIISQHFASLWLLWHQGENWNDCQATSASVCMYFSCASILSQNRRAAMTRTYAKWCGSLTKRNWFRLNPNFAYSYSALF